MNIENKDIEDIFRGNFSEYEIQPSDSLWGKLEGKLRWQEFLSFSLSSFNVYYFILMLSAITLGLFLLIKSGKEPLNNEGAELVKEFQTEIRNEALSNGLEVELNSNVNQENIEKTHINEIEEGRNGDEPAINREQLSSKGSDINLQSESALHEDKKVNINNEERKTDHKVLTFPRPGNENSTEVLINFSVFPKSGCAPLNVKFENYSRINGAFEWHFGDGGKSTLEDPVYLFDEPGEYVISLSVFMEDGSVFSAKKIIEVYAKPKAAFEIYQDNISDVAQPVIFLNYSKGADKYLWLFGDGHFSEEISPEHYYRETGNYDVKLKVISNEGCADSTIITNAFENAGCKIEFPTAFLPNINGPSNGYYSDGLTTNEVFHPEFKGVTEYQLKIFNRNGLLIFESNDINRGWDGYMNDRLAKRGVYIWKVRGRFINGQTFVKFGNVTLIKK